MREVAREKRDVIADFLCARGWWEEKLRYLSVCVGFLYTACTITTYLLILTPVSFLFSPIP